jgi:hypothetical protein
VAKYYRIGAAAVAWFALVLQYYLTITKPGAPFLEATVRYFSFFTYLTNILVALALTLPWISLALIGIDRRMGRSNEQAAGVAT